MNAPLPDISLTEIVSSQSSLDWVGMQGIDLPVTVAEPDYRRDLHAQADVHIDLPSPHVKGIHMSRLYRLIDRLGEGDPLSPAALRDVLRDIVDSHQDCDSRSARLRLIFDLLVRRPALVTEGLSGWMSYPVRLDGVLVGDRFRCRAQVTVTYSSTCPCSAALARQLVEQGFVQDFEGQTSITTNEVAKWLRQHATRATPHSQRSEALVAVDLFDGADSLGLLALIERIEKAVNTPVQTAVKRADEQAFAALNGQNLMFVEDAARRIKAALNDYIDPTVHVRHFESLHPHDAVAWASSSPVAPTDRSE